MTLPYVDLRQAFISKHKGCRLSILFALFAADTPLSKTMLCDWTGYKIHTVIEAVTHLTGDGLLTPIDNGRHDLYQLTHQARQLPFAWNESARLPAAADQLEGVSLRPLPPSSQPALISPDIAQPECGPFASEILTEKNSQSASSVVVDESINSLTFNQDLTTTSSLAVTAKKSQSVLFQKFFRALRAGKVWPSVAKSLAAKLESGEIPLTTLDVLGIVVWGQAEANQLGAFVQHHVALGNVPDDQFKPPTEEFEMALRWVNTDSYSRNELFVLVCPACQFVVRDWLDPDWITCPDCATPLTTQPADTSTHLPRWADLEAQ